MILLLSNLFFILLVWAALLKANMNLVLISVVCSNISFNRYFLLHFLVQSICSLCLYAQFVLSWLLKRLGSQEVMIFALGAQSTGTPRKQVSSGLLAIKLMFTFLLRRDHASVLHLFSVENGLSRSQKHLLKLCQMNASLRSLEGCLQVKKGVHVPVFPSAGLCF